MACRLLRCRLLWRAKEINDFYIQTKGRYLDWLPRDEKRRDGISFNFMQLSVTGSIRGLKILKGFYICFLREIKHEVYGKRQDEIFSSPKQGETGSIIT